MCPDSVKSRPTGRIRPDSRGPPSLLLVVSDVKHDDTGDYMSSTSAPRRLASVSTLVAAFALLAGALLFAGASPAAADEASPRLKLTKSGSPDKNVKAGQEVTYTYTVKNESTGRKDEPITHIRIKDDTVTGITCEDTSLKPGYSTTCTGTYTVTEEDVKHGKIVNTAHAIGWFCEEKVRSNEATFTVTTKPKKPVQASLSIDKKARVDSDCRKKCENDGYAAKGDKIFYTYRVTNTGNVTISDVAVYDPKAGPVKCRTTTLARGTSTDCHAVKPYVVTWSDVKHGKVVNTARATGRFYDEKIVSDPATVTVCIRHGKFDHRKHDDKDDDKDDKELPVTGDETIGALSLGGGLLAAGGLLLGASRLRRPSLFRG
ncbi:LPXTG cell wall anchor domain-containing protein [Micromonospora sp. WMMC415]|uniref:DUF7507 domain-containing protein n=1 Tax=Micromonospora sp. WMMC415 TaxID=2675222 RepID=UPI0018B000D5|nr:LPXTG cell wall anchor domain-containing protein [Micromonospora sp. WMMC415]